MNFKENHKICVNIYLPTQQSKGLNNIPEKKICEQLTMKEKIKLCEWVDNLYCREKYT